MKEKLPKMVPTNKEPHLFNIMSEQDKYSDTQRYRSPFKIINVLVNNFQSGTLSDQSSNESGGGGGGAGPDTSSAAEPSGDQLAMESSERDTPSHAYNGPPPPAPPPHNRRQNPPHHQAHHPLGKALLLPHNVKFELLFFIEFVQHEIQ